MPPRAQTDLGDRAPVLDEEPRPAGAVELGSPNGWMARFSEGECLLVQAPGRPVGLVIDFSVRQLTGRMERSRAGVDDCRGSAWDPLRDLCALCGWMHLHARVQHHSLAAPSGGLLALCRLMISFRIQEAAALRPSPCGHAGCAGSRGPPADKIRDPSRIGGTGAREFGIVCR